MNTPLQPGSGLRNPGDLFGKAPNLPPLADLLRSANQSNPATPAPLAKSQALQPQLKTDSSQIQNLPIAKKGHTQAVGFLDQPAGKALAPGVWYDHSRRTQDGGVIRLLTLDPAKAELVPVFNNLTPVSAKQIEADKSLLAAINASFFANGIIGDIQAGSKRSTDDSQIALDKVTDQRHFIAVAQDGSVHTGIGGLSENQAAGFKNFIGGFPALYTRSQYKQLDQDIRTGAFAKRAHYGGDSQSDSVSRSFIGINSEGKILLMAAGNGSERGKGVSMVEGARLMRELGALEAYILDGGGSSTLFARGVEHAHTDGRQVWSYLGVRSRQVAQALTEPTRPK